MEAQRNVCGSFITSSLNLTPVSHIRPFSAPLGLCWCGTGGAEGQSRGCLKAERGGTRCKGHSEEEEDQISVLHTSFLSRYRNHTEAPFSCSDVGEQWREGESAEVRKLRPRSSKGTLMDLEIQVGGHERGTGGCSSAQSVQNTERTSFTEENGFIHRTSYFRKHI